MGCIAYVQTETVLEKWTKLQFPCDIFACGFEHPLP